MRHGLGGKLVPPLGGRLTRIRLPLLTPRLALRLPQRSDVPLLTRYMNDPRVSRPLTSRHAPYTRLQEVAWVNDSIRAAAKGKKLNLAITLREGGTLVGGIGLEVPDWDNGRGWTGYWLIPQHWHKGYASEAASALCSVAFERLRLHRMEANVFDFNPRSMRLLRRLGFKREGKRRETYHRSGRWHDELAFGLLATEFRPVDLTDRGLGRSDARR
ncbi:MAG TPA: GNAT family protein [Thermoplasmata archaeon]|nr:GNAT family protein [Thermoplasmata archaeon]